MPDSVERQFGADDVGRDAGRMERQPLDPESALACLRQVVLDVVEISVVDDDAASVDLEPRPTVEDPASPAADLGDLPRQPTALSVSGEKWPR